MNANRATTVRSRRLVFIAVQGQLLELCSICFYWHLGLFRNTGKRHGRLNARQFYHQFVDPRPLLSPSDTETSGPQRPAFYLPLASDGLQVNNQAVTTETLNTAQKAQRINQDARRYGTFAEIGAGQEV